MTRLPRLHVRALIAVALGAAAQVLAAAPLATPSPPPAATAGHELVLGRVSDNPKSDYQKLKPMLDYVVPRMADLGITGGRVLMARDNQQMISYLRRGKVDWLTETAGAAMAYQERARAKLLLWSERGRMRSYQSVFFARRDAGIASLADLRGRAIAFQNTASTSAYFLPASELLDAGLPLVILASPSDRPTPDVVGFMFARSEFNISAWVQKGLVDAGVFSDQDWAKLKRERPVVAAELAEFHRTRYVPRALELVRDGLDPRIEQRLAQLLLAAADDPQAKPALDAYWQTTAFRPLDRESLASLERLRSGVSRIHVEVE